MKVFFIGFRGHQEHGFHAPKSHPVDAIGYALTSREASPATASSRPLIGFCERQARVPQGEFGLLKDEPIASSTSPYRYGLARSAGKDR